jgi:4-amino-4-deoxy-L-arabinose transferase-like glycosyltransferase
MPAGPGGLPPQGYGVPDGGESGAAQQPGTGAPPAGQPDKRNQEIGQAGWERLFIEPLATEASWVFPLALLGIPLALALLGWRWPLSGKHLGLVLWAGWLLPEVIYFSFATGLFHAYYLIMLGPPLAALVAITAWALWRLLQRHRWLGWVLAALFSGITLAFQLFTLSRYPQNGGWIAALSLPIWLTGIGLLLWRGRLWLGKAALALVCLSLLIAPLAWSGMTAFNTQPNVMLPNPGPGDAKGPQRQDLSILSVQQQKILDYLLAHSDPDSYLVATLNARQAAPYILATLRPILTFGGFTGSDNVVDVKNLAQMVAGGELRFVLVEPGFERQKPKIAAWLQRQCTVVKLPGLKGRPLPQAGPSAPGGEPVALLDCG